MLQNASGAESHNNMKAFVNQSRLRGMLNSVSSPDQSYHPPDNMTSWNSLQSPADMLSSEVKMIRLRVSDLYRDPCLEPIFYKVWKLMIEV